MSDHEQEQAVQMERASAVQAEYAEELMEKANVVGVGIGQRQKEGEFTDEICLVVLVSHKVRLEDLAEEDRIPQSIDGVPIDVQATGIFSANAL